MALTLHTQTAVVRAEAEGVAEVFLVTVPQGIVILEALAVHLVATALQAGAAVGIVVIKRTNITCAMPPEQEVTNIISPPQRNAVPLVAILFVLCVVLISAAYYYFSPQWKVSMHQEQISEAVSLVGAGDYDAAITASEVVLNSVDSGSEYNKARSVHDVAQFATGERDKRIAAIRSVKETYLLNADDPFAQSRNVNALLGYLNAGFEQYVFDEVFRGEPFAKFYIAEDRATSIRSLAEHSFELAPSTESLFRIGQWYSDRIRNLYGDWNATPEEKARYTDEILKLLDQSDELLTTELAETNGHLFQNMIEPRYYFWHSYLYAVVAREKPEYLMNAKRSLEKLEDIYNTRLDANGNKQAIIGTRLPYAYANYAWALYEVTGEAGYPEARQNLDALIALVHENPEAHVGYYVSLIKKNIALPQTKWEEVYSARMMLRLSKMHEPFKQFIFEYVPEEYR